MSGLAPGRCQSRHAFSMTGIPYTLVEQQCSRDGGHDGDHQWIRGSWVMVRWDNDASSKALIGD